MTDGMLHHGFQEDLRALINKHSMDNQCNTPDFILAGMLTEHLEAYRKTMAANMRWHEPKGIGQVGQVDPPIDDAPVFAVSDHRYDADHKGVPCQVILHGLDPANVCGLDEGDHAKSAWASEPPVEGSENVTMSWGSERPIRKDFFNG